ncbi:MAG: T9SS type A sorting domain-containing protein [Fidelibacterota bacterium]|nr:MAG: T9SS type A sorting domain-containing protein [Candidatus Neomarinimicrobiota bacterium]
MRPLCTLACPRTVGEVIPDSSRVTLSLPHLTLPPDTNIVVVPVELRNEWDEVGGLQLDISCGDFGLTLDTILTTERTAGWSIDLWQQSAAGVFRILLFDPAGKNVAVGAGPIMELVLNIPEDAVIPDINPLRLIAVVVSDPMGGVLPSSSENGSLTAGEVVEFEVSETEADQGEAVRLAVSMSNTGQVIGTQFNLFWDPDILTLVGASTTDRTARFQLEWQVSGDSLLVPQKLRGAGGRIWLYAQAGNELKPGTGDILELTFKVAAGTYLSYSDIHLLDVRVMVSGGRERVVTRIKPGRVSVFPGYLDPPRSLIAMSGQDGRVSLSWAPPTDRNIGKEALLLVDDDASQLGPPYFDAGGQMANDLTTAGYTFDYYSIPPGSNGPPHEVFQHAHTVIWMTGYEWGYHPTLTPDDQTVLADFLEQGGRVWLIGQDIIWDIGDDFISRHFGARSVAEDVGTPEVMIGSADNFMVGTEYPATALLSGTDYGDALTTSNKKAGGLVEGLSHLGSVGQDHTAFWGLEYGFILGRMDRINGIQRQLAAFGIEPSLNPGIGSVLIGEHASRYAPRAPSPVKDEALSQGYSPVSDSPIRLPAVVPPTRQDGPLFTGYSIYRGREIPVPLRLDTQVAAVGPDVLSFVDTTVTNGQRYKYVVTARYEEQFESESSNQTEAIPISWVDFSVGEIMVMAGGQAAIPILMENEDPVSGIRFEIRGLPSGHLSNPRVVLGKHAPPDWVVSLEQDTSSGILSIVGFSPRLTAIPPGKGEVLLLIMDAEAVIPTKVNLEAGRVVISDAHGDAYQVRVSSGSVFIDIQLAWLRVGTGAPTQPGDTGYVSIFMDNPLPVVAFQLVVRSASDALQVMEVQGGSRLPADAHLAFSDLGNGDLRLIESSFSGIPIAAGQGLVATIVYRVDPDAPEGLVKLNLEDVVLSDEQGLTLRQTTVSGSFPIGEVRAVFAPVSSEGEPGRTVTVPLGLANSIDLCGFQMTLDYDSSYLAFLSFEALERIADPDELSVEPYDPAEGKSGYGGGIRFQYTPGDNGVIQAGTGPLLNLIFLLDAQTPDDTSLSIFPGRVTSLGCEDRLVFTLGQEGEITVGKLPPEPEHFTVDIEPTGITHFIQVQASTLGGAYLNAGDELAAIDSAGWVSLEGEVGHLIVGAGVVQPDGSVNITAVMGFSRPDPFGEPYTSGFAEGDYLEVLPGARVGGTIHFQAWDRETGQEGRSSTDARYVLGEGIWGENNGLTIVEMVRIPEQVRPAPELFPEGLEVASNDPNPFSDTTTIRFGLPEEMEVKVTVFDLMGREVITLHDGMTAAGYHEVVWNGIDAAGMTAKNGMYFYRVRTPDGTVTHKLLLMR